MIIQIELHTVGAMKDLQHYFFDNADNLNADLLGAAAQKQREADIQEFIKQGANPEERLRRLMKP
jgi:hypothetical protein